MYVLVRNDLPPGLQMAQAVHAGISHVQKCPDVPLNLVVLQVRNEIDLVDRSFGHDGTLFREPDIGNEATAFACVSDGRSFSDLPLAGRVMA